MLIEDGKGVVDFLPEARLTCVQVLKAGRRVHYVKLAPFQPAASVVKRGRPGRPEVCRVRLNMDQIGYRLLVLLAAELPESLEGVSRSGVARAVGVSKQAINHHVRSVEKAVRAVGRNDQVLPALGHDQSKTQKTK